MNHVLNNSFFLKTFLICFIMYICTCVAKFSHFWSELLWGYLLMWSGGPLHVIEISCM